MRKNVFAATAAIIGLSLASSSSAQSSVTLYGLIDVGVDYLSDAQTGRTGNALSGRAQYSLQDGAAGGLSGSRWGLSGIEDLGGSLKAVFQLENGFAINNGTLAQGAEFTRQAYVGLQSRFGTVTLGRQYDPVVSFVQPYVAGAQWAGYASAHPGDVDNLLNTRRINNAVKYTSPSYAGFSFGGLYSLGGMAGSVGRDQVWSLGAAYTIGSFGMAVGYLNSRNPNFSFFGANALAGAALSSNNLGSQGSSTSAESGPILAGYASANTIQIIAAGANYVVGGATVGLAYSNTQFRGLGSASTSGPNPFGYSGTASFDNAEANFKYQISPTLLAGVAYDYTHASGASGQPGAAYSQASVGADYFMSKHTDFYAIAVYQHASGIDSLDQPAVANITGQTASANDHQVFIRFGLRHRF